MLGISGKTKGTIVAVADVGSGSAAFALVSTKKGCPSKILASQRVILPIQERPREACAPALMDALTQAGESILKEYAKTGGAPIGALYCIIRAPWSKSKTARVKKTFETDTKITKALIKQLAQEALASPDLDKANFLEASIVRIELNGYPTGKPEGKLARSVSVVALASGCDPTMKDCVTRALSTLMPHHKPVFRSSVRALITVVQECVPHHEYLLLDVGTEATAIVAVRDGSPDEQVVVQEGVRTVLKRVASEAVPEETVTFMNMIAKDQCESAACKTLQENTAKVEPEIVKAFGEGMAECATPHRLPNILVLATHGDMNDWMKGFFSRIDFSQFTKTMQPFTDLTLGPKEFAPRVVHEKGVLFDGGVSFAAALVNIETAAQ